MFRTFLVCTLLLAGCCTARADLRNPQTPLERAFERLYNLDFTSAHRILDAYVDQHPEDPVADSTRASAYLFEELQRLQILE